MRNKTIIWVTVVATVLIEIGTVAIHWGDIKAGKPDFAALYGTAQRIRDGRAPVYNPQDIQGVDIGFDDSPSRPIVLTEKFDTLHPPFESLLFLPLTIFPYITAFTLWCFLNLVMLWAVPLALWKLLPHLQRDFHFISIYYGTMFSVIVCLVFGQDSILLLLLLSLAYRATTRNREITAGILLALGMFKFQLVLPIVFAYAVIRRWRMIWGFCLGMGGVFAASVAMFGIKGAISYIPFILHVGRHVGSSASDRTIQMPNLRGLVTWFASLWSVSVQNISLVVVVLSLAIYVSVLIWLKRHGSAPVAIQFSVLVVVSSIISFHYYAYNSSILLLPLLLTANQLASGRQKSAWNQVFAALALSIYLAPAAMNLSKAMPVIGICSIILLVLLMRVRREMESLAGSN